LIDAIDSVVEKEFVKTHLNKPPAAIGTVVGFRNKKARVRDVLAIRSHQPYRRLIRISVLHIVRVIGSALSATWPLAGLRARSRGGGYGKQADSNSLWTSQVWR
jgi:hypothetical protein